MTGNGRECDPNGVYSLYKLTKLHWTRTWLNFLFALYHIGGHFLLVSWLEGLGHRVHRTNESVPGFAMNSRPLVYDMKTPIMIFSFCLFRLVSTSIGVVSFSWILPPKSIISFWVTCVL